MGGPYEPPLDTPDNEALERLTFRRSTPARLVPARLALGPMKVPDRTTHPEGSDAGVPTRLLDASDVNVAFEKFVPVTFVDPNRAPVQLDDEAMAELSEAEDKLLPAIFALVRFAP